MTICLSFGKFDENLGGYRSITQDDPDFTVVAEELAVLNHFPPSPIISADVHLTKPVASGLPVKGVCTLYTRRPTAPLWEPRPQPRIYPQKQPVPPGKASHLLHA